MEIANKFVTAPKKIQEKFLEALKSPLSEFPSKSSASDGRSTDARPPATERAEPLPIAGQESDGTAETAVPLAAHIASFGTSNAEDMPVEQKSSAKASALKQKVATPGLETAAAFDKASTKDPGWTVVAARKKRAGLHRSELPASLHVPPLTAGTVQEVETNALQDGETAATLGEEAQTKSAKRKKRKGKRDTAASAEVASSRSPVAAEPAHPAPDMSLPPAAPVEQRQRMSLLEALQAFMEMKHPEEYDPDNRAWGWRWEP